MQTPDLARILAVLDDQVAGKVLSKKDLAQAYSTLRRDQLNMSTSTVETFVAYLREAEVVTRAVLKSIDYQDLVRYVRPDCTSFELALGLRRGSYLSHGTALSLHRLADASPSTIYVNAEQSEKPKPQGGLTQTGIDRAFRGTQRSSKLIYLHENTTYVLIAGKQSGDEGVELLQSNPKTILRVTGMPRTLVDAVVRPTYCGGAMSVLSAFAAARARTTGVDLLRMLDRLDYAYPYYQALGFYLERAGYDRSEFREVELRDRMFDFYLQHGTAGELRFDAKWRIHYPAALDR